MLMVCKDTCRLLYRTRPMGGMNSGGLAKCITCGVRFREELGVYCPCCGVRLSYRIKGKKNNEGKPRI